MAPMVRGLVMSNVNADLVILADFDAQGPKRYRRQAFDMWFDAYASTHVIVWASSFDDAAEKAAQWVADNQPGLLTKPDYEQARKEWREENTSVPENHPVQPVGALSSSHLMTCGTCGLTWEDSIATSMTPAPSGRCPFEEFHADDTTDEAEEEIRDLAETDLTYFDRGIWIASWEWGGSEIDRAGIKQLIADMKDRGRVVHVEK